MSVSDTQLHAVLELAQQFGITPQEMIAVGDSYNDIEMIEMAGLGVAVNNARDEVKQAADYVTENSHEADAVKEVIDKFILC